MSNEEKQIEEMAKDLGDTWVVDLEGNPHDLSEVLMRCDIENISEQMHEIGYRKASEVVREIIAEIEQAQTEITDRLEEFIKEYKEYSESTVDYFGGKYEAMEVALRLVKSILTDKYAELKKKYESEGEK